MTTSQALVAFALAAGLITMTPGLDTALVLRTAVAEGARNAAMAAAGICVGVLTWGTVTAAGLAAMLASLSIAYDVLRWLGAAYLVYLGWGMVRRPRTTFDGIGKSPGRTRNWFVRGLMSNTLNPKVGVFYITMFPQFVPRDALHPRTLMIAFTSIHAIEGAMWLAFVIIGTNRFAAILRRPRVIRALDRTTGVVLIGFGVRVATDSGR